MENEGGETRNFRTYLVLDYKTKKFRVLRKLNKLKPSEIVIDLSLDVSIPKAVMLKAKGSIELSTAKVNDIVLEELQA
jgi:hypothetical protein